MKIIVCGSIGYGGLDQIREVQSLLIKEGFQIIDQFSERKMDYTGISDFRDKKDLSEDIVKHDLELIKKSDIVIVVSNGPSYGTAIEMYIAKQSGKKVLFFCMEEVPTPWPIFFSDYVVKTKKELIEILKKKVLE